MRGPEVSAVDQLAEILDRLGAAADAIGTLEDLPGSFYVDITIRMHHHPGDGYTNRDVVTAAEKLGEWLGLLVRVRNADEIGLESPTAAGGTGYTCVHGSLVSVPTPATTIDLDL